MGLTACDDNLTLKRGNMMPFPSCWVLDEKMATITRLKEVVNRVGCQRVLDRAGVLSHEQ